MPVGTLIIRNGSHRGGGINWELRIDIYPQLYLKQITDKDLLYSTGNFVITYKGKPSEKLYIYMYI